MAMGTICKVLHHTHGNARVGEHQGDVETHHTKTQNTEQTQSAHHSSCDSNGDSNSNGNSNGNSNSNNNGGHETHLGTSGSQERNGGIRGAHSSRVGVFKVWTEDADAEAFQRGRVRGVPCQMGRRRPGTAVAVTKG